MSLLEKLRKQQEQPRLPNPVAVPELAHLFEKGEPPLFYIATLSGLEKDSMDAAFITYCKRNDIPESSEREIWRSFMIAYCLCDASNNRTFANEKELDELVTLIADTGNLIISRLWLVCNGANRLLGVDEVLKKSSEEASQKMKKGGGNGASRSTSATPAEQPG